MAYQAFKKTSLNTVNRYLNRGTALYTFPYCQIIRFISYFGIPKVLEDLPHPQPSSQNPNGFIHCNFLSKILTGIYDYKNVHDLIDRTPLLHVAFSPTPSSVERGDGEPWYPVILPMLGCTGDYHNDNNVQGSVSEGPRAIYLHGYISSRLMRLTSTHDADVSDVAYGRAHVVTEEAERKWAVELITDNLLPGRASAKVRTGTTGEDRGDLKDEEMRRRVWAGVVPAHLVWGEPVAAPTNLMDTTPRYIEEWRRQETSEAENYAYAAAK
ncbi:hypothetical protein C2857_000479 [Epichloe festucae Fl1]|uniref:Flavin-nucleotide-binding protein n=1 Tax=Epichloe festucae (strain Fl1) TaxID=877507 RepID=A0A7U3SN54_EPIFF|nr:hypothetical protein C2857_000479 [Epichloe festucae Fl1]